MEKQMGKKVIKQILVDVDKCIGCRACELACSAFHASPRYSSTNPARSRIRVMIDDLKDIFVPLRAGEYTPAECTGRYAYRIDGKEYRECGFCKAACPTRNYFMDPATGLPLRCDMCESDPPLELPWCVKVCGCDALTYAETIEETLPEKEKKEGIEVDLEALADRYGMNEVAIVLARMAGKD